MDDNGHVIVGHPTPTRGQLRVLLGAAPGVGKTYAMLAEGRRRRERGADVVVAFVETHGRRHTAAQLEGLEVVPRRHLTHQGADFTEMDLDAVLQRRPDVALVDELAHTNVPGTRNARRWEDIEELLSAGIDVITTVNVQHLESLNDVVRQITGVRQRETVPDAIVRSADQIELIDMAPEALRRRMAHGNVYRPEKVDAALKNYFRPGNLAALRELALLWVADRVDAGLTDYRRTHEITGTWAARDRVLVALSGGPEGAVLIRRGARIASKGVGGELVAVYVARSDGLVARDRGELAQQQRLVSDLSGTFHTVTGHDPAQVVLEHARSINATQVVVGVTRRRAWQRLLGPSVSQRIIADAGDIDVHIVSHDLAGTGQGHPRPAPLSLRRRLIGHLAAVILPMVITLALLNAPSPASGALALMTGLAGTVAVALIGGVWPAVIAAIFSSLLVNWFFTPPLNTLTIADPQNILSLMVFVVVGIAVATVVDGAARRARSAAEARAEADTLAWLTSQTRGEAFSVENVLAQIQQTFRLDRVELRQRERATSPWQTVAVAGVEGDEPDTIVALDDLREFALSGRALTVAEQRVVDAFGTQVLNELERKDLAATAATADELAQRNSFQTALLAAVSHDLRTPLAAIKASSSSLLADDVELSCDDQSTLLGVVDENADRLERLIENLLDMTRIETGTMSVHTRPTLIDEVLRPAIAPHRGLVTIQKAAGLPMIVTDAGLAERVIANLVDNALRHQPPGHPVQVTVAAVADRAEVQVIDRGPGVPPSRRTRMFEPFQRVGDTPAGKGLGLGLSVAAGLAAATGARIDVDDTPGGGLTMVVSFPTWAGEAGQ